MLIAALATPFLFYGLEFWEHAPAVALAANGTAMFVTACGGRKAAAAFAFGSGIAFGVAFLMRPELAWAFLAVVAAWQIEAGAPAQGGNRVRLLGLALAGFAIALAPLEIYTLRHFGRVMPAHLWANTGQLQTSWWLQRVSPAVGVAPAIGLDALRPGAS